MTPSFQPAPARLAGCAFVLALPLAAAAQSLPAAPIPTSITAPKAPAATQDATTPPLTPSPAPGTATGQTGSIFSLPVAGRGGAIVPVKIGVASIPTPAANASITLEQALALAVANEPNFLAAIAAAKNANVDRDIARGRGLPSVLYHNQYIYTQSESAGAHVKSPEFMGQPKFINNDLIHHYFSQLSVTETVGATEYASLQRASANLALANAQLEIARRGLNATVISLFYNLVTSQNKAAVQQRAVNEAADFLKVTRLREDAGEVSHYDVIKGQLQLQQHERDLAVAQLAASKSRLDLGVLLYPDPRTPYTVSLPEARPVPERSVVEAANSSNNADLRSAAASLRSSQAGVKSAVALFFPDLILNYAYGIDAPQFAANGRNGERWLGYAAFMTLDIPLFDWFVTPNRVKQAHISRDASTAVLSTTKRRVIANFEQFYATTQVAYNLVQSLETSVADSREGLRLVRLRYTNGDATVLEVVDAQNTLTTAELAFEDGTVSYQLALANLQTLTGTI